MTVESSRAGQDPVCVSVRPDARTRQGHPWPSLCQDGAK